MSTFNDTSVSWGHFGPKSTFQALKSEPGGSACTAPLGRFDMIRRLFYLRKVIDSRDMVGARRAAVELSDRGCSINAPVLTAILAEMTAEIEVHCGRYHVAETLLRESVIPGYRGMPDCVSKRARMSLQSLYSVRDNAKHR